MLGKVWKYHNETTGHKLECNDFGFLIDQLRNFHGLLIPDDEFASLIIKGKLSCEVKDSEGNSYEISIVEFDVNGDNGS